MVVLGHQPWGCPSAPKIFLEAVAQCGHVLSHVLVLQEDAFWGGGWGVWVNAGGPGVCGGGGRSILLQIFTALLCVATVHTKSPPLGIVRRFIHLLEQSQHDFWEESEVLRLQEEVVKRIRASRQLESDLDLMDIKIGLLVKNRITLQVGRVGEDSVASCGPALIAAWTCLCFTF